MNVLCQAQPPPHFWHLRIELAENGDPQKLYTARNIINTYLDPELQWTRRRIKKGIHQYCLAVVDEKIDSSILQTIKNELWGHAIVRREDIPCQENT